MHTFISHDSEYLIKPFLIGNNKDKKGHYSNTFSSEFLSLKSS